MAKVTYNHRGSLYEITYTGEGIQDAEWFKQQLLAAEKMGDWVTVNNKITGGLAWGHIKRIENDVKSRELRDFNE